jgi:hypothetical protein
LRREIFNGLKLLAACCYCRRRVENKTQKVLHENETLIRFYDFRVHRATKVYCRLNELLNEQMEAVSHFSSSSPADIIIIKKRCSFPLFNYCCSPDAPNELAEELTPHQIDIGVELVCDFQTSCRLVASMCSSEMMSNKKQCSVVIKKMKMKTFDCVKHFQPTLLYRFFQCSRQCGTHSVQQKIEN